MRRPGRLRFAFDLSPVAHPVWWLALVVLVVNDHLLKGAGIVPGWLTGKLSDFAFLIVAPVLAAVALPAAVRGRRAIALVAVGALFTAAKLSRVVSDEVVGALRHVGLVWRLWPDPTDLVALAMLPVAARVLRAAPRGLARLLPQRAGVLLGAVACAATSALPSYEHNAFLLNAAPATESVQITWVLRQIPCPGDDLDAGAATVAAFLTPGDLDDPIKIDLDSGQVAALDGPLAAGTSPAGICTANPWNGTGAGCVGAILEAPPAAPVLVVATASWRESDGNGGCGNSSPPVFRCEPQLDPTADPGPDAVTLKDASGQLQFVAGKRVGITPIDLQALAGRATPANNCRALRDQYETLLQPQPCASDGDCVAVSSLDIAAVPAGACGVDANLTGAQALDRLGVQWSTACRDVYVPSCPPQPAVCRAGTCAPVCPGETIPSCPGPCYDDYGTVGTQCSGDWGTPCARPGGYVCNCVNAKVACSTPQPVSATCPLTCLDSSGGTYVHGLVVHPPLDAGAPPEAGRPDGGTDAASADAGADARD